MQKNQNTKLLTALGLMLVLAISPLAVANAQTSITTSTDASVSANSTAAGSGSANTSVTEDDRKDKLREKAKKRADELRDRQRDFRPTIAFKGETNGWALIGGVAHKSSISLHDGKAAKVGEHQWRMVTNGTISAGDKTFDVELKGKAHSTKRNVVNIQLHGTVMIDGKEHRIGLVGYVLPTSEDNTFALAFTKLGFKGERYHFLQVGQVTISPLPAANISAEQSQKDMASFRAIMSVE
jgi:hypothetical protein